VRSRRRSIASAGCSSLLITAMAVISVGSTAGAAAPAKRKTILQVLITNDDGVSAPGIDALVEAVRTLPRVKVTVVAPATNQSGTGAKTSPGTLVPEPTMTISGFPAFAVHGFPADSILVALAGADRTKPDVVLSGINQGQNLGTLSDLSGTVGAARTAARHGIPALAVSQGIGSPPDFTAGAKWAVKWLKEHRKKLLGHPTATVDNLNVPTCVMGAVRGEIDVPLAASAENAVSTSDCASTLMKPVDDIQAFNNGYATLTTIPSG
jgi:5'-nucleotidase